MTYTIDILNQICTDLGATQTYKYDIDAINFICISLGGSGGHKYEIDALNEICTIQAVTTGHKYNIDALNAIASGLYNYEDSAWSAIQQGCVLGYNPANDEDLNLWLKLRNELILTDTISSNDAKILPVIFKLPSGTSSQIPIDSSLTINENSIWVVKGKCPTYEDFTRKTFGGNFSTGANFCISQATSSPWNRIALEWGNLTVTAENTLMPINEWKTFIIYDKKLWVLPLEIDINDNSLLDIITNTAPDVNAVGAVWSDNNKTLKYLHTQFMYDYSESSIIQSKFGYITSNVITWQAEHIFNNKHYVYDRLGNDHIEIDSVTPTLYYEEDMGNSYLLDNGYSVYMLSGSPLLQVPFTESGVPQTNPPVPNGYVWIADINGVLTNHNLADSIIEFTGSWFDRSNTTIYEDAARLGYYNASHPTQWHISEINELLLHEYLKTDYKGIWFPKVSPNSVDIEMREKLLEVLAYDTNKTGTDFEDVLRYTKDFNYIII